MSTESPWRPNHGGTAYLKTNCNRDCMFSSVCVCVWRGVTKTLNSTGETMVTDPELVAEILHRKPLKKSLHARRSTRLLW